MSYSENFISNHCVSLPIIGSSISNIYSQNGFNIEDYYLDYNNYSLLHNPVRYFPYYTASNIDGRLFKKIAREDLFHSGKDYWKKDSRIPESTQLGSELYTADKSDFDRGHLTKREDVQWGSTISLAKQAAVSTFYYTNAVPQIDRLNRGVWRRIEDYILHSEVIENSLKISLFSGPVLQNEDPDFVTDINGRVIKLPYLFWKIIYYEKIGELYRTGFLTSQKGLLTKKGLILPVYRSTKNYHEPFMNFKDAETYQVRVNLIEKITRLTFKEAIEVFEDDTPEKLILSGIDVRNSTRDTQHSNIIINITL